jgi:class 3 adenylate cyclase/tetratricopeptide (TPR) repeat protein
MGCGARLGKDIRPDTRKPVTILFNDVAGSTRLGEQVEAETVRKIMSRYFEVVSSILERHGGTVEKFIGDAAMAVFGMPRVQEDHALRAVRAAAELKAALGRLNEELAREWGIRIATRTGVNSGEVVAGDPAGGQTLVTGDPVNLAARLEQAAAPGEVLIGETTRGLLGDSVVVERVEPLRLKGKEKPVSAWRLVEVTSRHGQPARRLEGPMLGRDRELQALRDLFDRAVREQTACRALVLGPAGIGKSRLAHELTAAIADRASIFVGSCLPYGEGITYWPVAEVVHQVAGDEPRAAIAGLLPDDPRADLIAERVLQAVGVSEGGGTGKDLTWAIRRFIEALARRRPTLIVFEDIHWAEPAMLDLIDYITASVSDVPLMLLCLARQDVLEQRPDWAAGDGVATTFVLDRLSDASANELIEELRPQAVAEDVRNEIVARAEGNPLFIEQMLALLREPGFDRGTDVLIPPTIQALIAARLDRLQLDELSVIGAASVIGQEFWPAAVEALSGRDGQALETLVRKDLIRPEPAMLAGEEGFIFRHGLIRDAAYETLTKEDRAALHERFANWLEQHHRERLIELEAILGYHLEQAYRYRADLGRVDEEGRALARRAATRLGSAGRRAGRAREDAAALNLLSRAGKLLPQAAHERLELLPLIGESLEGTANHKEAGVVYGEALEGALDASHRAVEGRARLGRAHVWFVANPEKSLDEIIAETEQAIAVLEEVGDERGLAEAWRLVGEARFYQGNAAEGQRALERALGQLADGPSRTLNALLFSLGMCLLDGPTPLARAAAFANERLEHARAESLPSLEADMLHVLGVAEGRLGDLESARRSLAGSTTISEELGLAYMAQWSKRSLGRLELAAGNPEAAERELRSSYDLLAEMGLKGSLGEAAVPLAEALYEQGRHDEAARLLDTVTDELAAGDASIEAPRLCVRAKLFVAEGWIEHAERASRRALRLVLRTDWACLKSETLIAHAEVLRLADRLSDASSGLRDALAIAESKGYELAAGHARELLAQASREAARPSSRRLS